MGPSHAGELVDPAGSRTRARVARGYWSTPRALGLKCESPGISGRLHGSSDLFPSARDSWSSPQVLGHKRKWPGTADRPRMTSDPRASGPVLLVESEGPRAQARVSQATGRLHGLSDTSQSPPGLLVNPGGPQTQAQVARECCSTPRALGHSPESPRKAGRHFWPLGMGPSHRGRLVHPVRYRT